MLFITHVVNGDRHFYFAFCMKERILLDAMFDVPGTDIVEVVLTEDVVCGGKSPEYVRRSPIECEEAETASAELRRSSV